MKMIKPLPLDAAAIRLCRGYAPPTVARYGRLVVEVPESTDVHHYKRRALQTLPVYYPARSAR